MATTGAPHDADFSPIWTEALLPPRLLDGRHAFLLRVFTHVAAQKVYELLGAKEKIAIAFRDGAHAHTFSDWRCFLDFADRCFVSRQN